MPSGGAAPATQPHSSARSAASSAGSGAVFTTSEIASRPPGFSTRKASRNTCALSGTRFITQFEITSAVLSAIGRCSSSPRRNSTLAAPAGGVVARLVQHLMRHVDADDRRWADLAGGEKQSKPAPLPRSTTSRPAASRRSPADCRSRDRDGAVGHAASSGLGVAHPPRFVVGRRRSPAAAGRRRRRAAAAAGRAAMLP